MKTFYLKTFSVLMLVVMLISSVTAIVTAAPSFSPAGPPALPPTGPTPDSSLAVHALTYAPSPLDNPLKGFAPYSPNINGYPHSLEWNYIGLSDLMSGANSFTWAPLDNLLNDIASHGNQAAIRVYIEYPGRALALPSYLNSLVALRNNTAWPQMEPDYDDPDMIQALKNFIAAYGARYDGDARIGFITMGLVGLWGEWHTWPFDRDTSDGNPNYFPTDTTINTVIDAYDAAFNKTQLEIRYADLGAGHTVAANIGYHDDSWCYKEGSPLHSVTLPISMGGSTDAFLERELSVGGENKWIKQSIGGEVRPEIQMQLFTGGSQVDNVTDCIEMSHATWMLDDGGIATYSASDATVAAAVRKMGYELFVRNAYFNNPAAGSAFKVGVQIENRAVAPFSYPWTVLVGAKDSSGNVVQSWTTTWDIRNVQPLQIRNFPDWNAGTGYRAFGQPYYYEFTTPGLSSGTYTLAMKVVNPLSTGKAFRFANTTQNADGWLDLGSITVGTGVSPTITPGGPTATRTNTPLPPTATPPGGGANLLSNPGIESGTAGWTAWGTVGLSQDSGVKHGGSYSLKMFSRSGQASGPKQDITSILAANGQGTYNLGAWVKSSIGTQTMHVSIVVNGNTYFPCADTTVGAAAWVQLSCAKNITWSSLTSAYLYVEGVNAGDTGDFNADDFSLTLSGGGPTATNTSVPPTATKTNTPVPATNTPTRTSTLAGPTNTPTRTSTRTNTPSGPTNTPTRTNTPAPATNTPTKTNTPVGPTPTSVAVLLLDNFDGSPAWPGGNDLGKWAGANSFSNGSGSGVLSGGALVLQYNNTGTLDTNITQSLSAYTYLVFVIKGAAGGEQNHFRVNFAGVNQAFGTLSGDTITTAYKTIRINMVTAGMNRTSPGPSLQLLFNLGGTGTVTIDEIRFE